MPRDRREEQEKWRLEQEAPSTPLPTVEAEDLPEDGEDTQPLPTVEPEG